MIEVRRAADGELCGFIDDRDGRWHAMTLFGGDLGAHHRQDDARRHVLDVGLASLADRWILVDGATGDEQIVCICEASPDRVTVALGYYSLPGVPSQTIIRTELDNDRWRLVRR
jgi:hypothetical protein